MKATRTFCPNANSPLSVDDPSARTSPICTVVPLSTIGLWLMQVPWLLRWNFISECSKFLPFASVTTISFPVTLVITPSAFDINTCPLSLATLISIPVPTRGFSGFNSGTACLCIFEPIRARLASSCSKNGIRDVETLTNCNGDTSMNRTESVCSMPTSSPLLVSTLSLRNSPASLMAEFAWAM